MCGPLSTPSGRPIPSISPMPSPIQSTGVPLKTPDPTPSPGVDGICYTDPHCRTFDGLTYDCQANGEFTMVKSEIFEFEVQVRFRGPDSNGTVTKGVAVSSKNAPVVQVSMAFTGSSTFETVASCPIILFVDGIITPFHEGTGSANVTVSRPTDTFMHILLLNGVSVDFGVQKSSKFGCFFENMRVFLPSDVIAGGDIIGLLGTPNGNPFDDWTDRSGTVLPPPRSQEHRLFQLAYDYCTRHWCIRSVSDSLFTYEAGTTFSDFNLCDVKFGKEPDFTKASEELRELCGEDTACLVDGLAGDIADARNALSVQAVDDASEVTARTLRFRPPTVAAGVTVNVRVTLDMSERGPGVADVTRFVLYRIDSDSGERISDSLLRLVDDGSVISSDVEAGDFVFNNFLALVSDKAGERLSFQAYPVDVEGDPIFNSPLLTTAMGAVRVYSTVSKLGSIGEEDQREVSVDSLVGLGIVAQYSWPNDKPDLDTATEFLGMEVGYNCSEDIEKDSPFLTFSGDDTSEGGTETAGVLLDSAKAEGKWTGSVVITFRAQWFKNVNHGPATLRTMLSAEGSGDEVRGSGMSLPISPGTGEGCASKIVARMVVKYSDDGATLRLLKTGEEIE